MSNDNQKVAPATPEKLRLVEKRETQGDRIISLLLAARRPLLPAEIAQKLGMKKNVARANLSKLAQKNLVIKEGEGYTLPRLQAEKIVEQKIGIVDQEKALPKLHDIHLLFKPENIRKCLGQQKNLNTLFMGATDRGATDTGKGVAHQKVFSHGNETIASLSDPPANDARPAMLASKTISRLVNPLDDYHISHVWPRDRTRDIKGGFQERFLIMNGLASVTIQIRYSGTIQIASGNSECPFNSAEFVSFLNVLDGIFIARAGISFREIAPFFFIDCVHINSDDDPAGHEYSGVSKLNITCNQLEEGLIRVYEKVMGGVPKVRTEFQLKGNFEQHSLGNLEPILATMFGGVNQAVSVGAALVANKSAQSASEDVKALAREARVTNKTIQDLMRLVTVQNDRLNRLEAKVVE